MIISNMHTVPSTTADQYRQDSNSWQQLRAAPTCGHQMLHRWRCALAVEPQEPLLLAALLLGLPSCRCLHQRCWPAVVAARLLDS